MRRTVLLAARAAGLAMSAAVPAARAQGGAIGLGIAVGAAFPAGSTAAVSELVWAASFNPGLYVNIPDLCD